MNTLLKWCGGAALTLFGSSCAGTFNRECATGPFQGRREIVETARLEESTDACWWLSSGGVFYTEDGVGHTILGALPPDSEWREKYARSSARDTDKGEHPQNLLRLVAKDTWQDYQQEVKFRIKALNMTDSPERDEWSGVLMFQRYQNQDNLYYTGVRMDGTAIIKKKLGGKYTTLAQQPVFGQPDWYDRAVNPCLLPQDRWLHLTSTVRNRPDGSVLIRLMVRDDAQERWQSVIEAVDDGSNGAPIREGGHTGLRGDFMDIEFTGYTVTPLKPETESPEKTGSKEKAS